MTSRSRRTGRPDAVNLGAYRLDDQIGFAIRRASQRHAAIFADRMTEQLTPTQWAALSKIAELGVASQNQLGRDTAMDAATIKGVVDRLIRRGLVSARSDPDDHRRSLIALTEEGRASVRNNLAIAAAISAETLNGLSAGERQMLLELLRKIA